jgi:hypothetical protein
VQVLSARFMRDSVPAHTDQAQFLEGEAGNRGATRTGRLEREAYFPSGFIHATLTEKTLQESGHVQVGNETDGVQTPKVTEASSLSWLGARESHQMVN